MSARPIGLAALALATASCAVILGIDKDYQIDSISGGTGGGATTSTTASVTGSGGGGGGSGGGASTTSSASGTGGGPLVCPATPNAPTMVNVGTYCIDSTEVTQSNFWKWADAHGAEALASPPAECAWKTTLAPAFGAEKYTQYPMKSVDWCDAAMFCAGVGRSLCGAKGGGPLAPDDATVFDAAQSTWFDACTDGGLHAYPYGDAYQPTACDGFDENPNNSQITVGSLPGCHGSMAPYDDIYDLSGNVYEWIDACDDGGGSVHENDMCRRLGGSSFSNETGLLCHGMQMTSQPRSFQNGTTGFRCCYP